MDEEIVAEVGRSQEVQVKEAVEGLIEVVEVLTEEVEDSIAVEVTLEAVTVVSSHRVAGGLKRLTEDYLAKDPFSER